MCFMPQKTKAQSKVSIDLKTNPLSRFVRRWFTEPNTLRISWRVPFRRLWYAFPSWLYRENRRRGDNTGLTNIVTLRPWCGMIYFQRDLVEGGPLSPHWYKHIIFLPWRNLKQKILCVFKSIR